MRKYGFIKKVCSVVTAAAMVASMGMTAFGYTDGNGITITNIGYQKVTGSSTLYEVTVNYETTVANDIGVTMLTYAKSGESLTEGTTYADGMQIVAIDQKAQATAGTGSFTFKVTTGSDNGAIKVEEDVPAVVRLGGDKVTSTAAGLLTIASVKEATVSSAKYEDTALSVDKYSYTTDTEVVAAIKNLGTVGVKVYATIGEDSKKVGTVQVDLANATSYTKQDDGSYKVSGFKITDASAINKEVAYTNYELSLPEGGVTVEDINVNVTMLAWGADKFELKGATDNKYEVTLTDGMTVDQVKQTLVGKYVVVSSTVNDKAKVELEITSDAFQDSASGENSRTKLIVVADATNPTTVAKDGTFKYTVYVPSNNDAFSLDSSAMGKFDVTITIVEASSVVYGDVNGDGKVNMTDARLIKQYYDEDIDASAINMVAAEVSGDGKVNMTDARLIKNFYDEDITSFPVESK